MARYHFIIIIISKSVFEHITENQNCFAINTYNITHSIILFFSSFLITVYKLPAVCGAKIARLIASGNSLRKRATTTESVKHVISCAIR